ncbi:ATP-dependent helicase HrpB [Micrococcus terreus]|uniref:ATP-dependent helicase HrpB n=1 Tax=Micrococcus terreus TaxID=574650 RepID=UPI00301630FE
MTSTSGAVLPGHFDLGSIGAGLVFADSIPQLQRSLAEHRAAVVQAPPGTGKTTLVPPAVANLLHQVADRQGPTTAPSPSRVILTQPRRVAARAAASRLAHLHGGALGDQVGYSVRGERRTGKGTLVEFLTPGVLVNRLLADPELTGVGAVILDEVHERDLESDLLFGMLGEVHQLREDLVLVAMSATLDAARFADRLGEGIGHSGPVPVVDCPSALHPVDVQYRPPSGPRLDERGVTHAYLDHLAREAASAHQEALAADPGIDALVFVPTARDVDQTVGKLERIHPTAEILPLHGQLPPAVQDRAVGGRAQGDPPRVIVSTALAESSLTVPGVRLVVDAGLSREPRRDTVRGMTGLVTVSCAQSSAEQRAGRAGRLGPGTVIRCYSRTTFGTAPAHPRPAAAVADLTGAALTLACWGAPGGEGLVLPDPLPAEALADAHRTLTDLGALDEELRPTALGRRLAAIPAEPRLARALLEGAALVDGRTAAEVVALVASDIRPDGADLAATLESLRRGTDPTGSGRGALNRWQHEATRLHRLTPQAQSDQTPTKVTRSGHFVPEVAGDGRAGAQRRVTEHAQVGAVVGLAFPERLARQTDTRGIYLLASGTRAALPPSSALAGEEWLAIAEVQRSEGRSAAGTGAVIRAAASVDQDLAVQLAGRSGTLLQDRTTAQWQDGRVIGRRTRTLGAITLAEQPVKPSPAAAEDAVRNAMQEHGLSVVGWPGSGGEAAPAEQLRRRLDLLHRHLGAPWPDVSPQTLADRAEEWLAPEISAVAAGRSPQKLDLAGALRRLLPWPEAVRLDELVPERLAVPSRRDARIEYQDGEPPVVAIKLQECFGLADTPALVDGREPVVFHLLSPAGRPLAVTADLASFWSGPYTQVRAEMRGRYPKHPWPEDPWTAPATARTTRRMQR